MGATFEYKHFPLLKKEEVQEAYTEFVRQLESEYGSNPYSGKLCTLEYEINFLEKKFDNEDEARWYLADTCQKYENPKAVQAPYNGVNGWLVGGICPC